MTTEICAYDAQLHFDSAVRHWAEINWGDGAEKEQVRLRRSWEVGSTIVGVIDGAAEALGHWVPGNVRHLDREVSMGAITAITTGPLARQHKFASRITARCLAEAANDGLATAGLGIFDQGFYDRMGFGMGSYDYVAVFDPAQLSVPTLDRTPVRLTVDDYEEVCAALHRRFRDHGSAVLDPPELVRAELALFDKPMGLGFRDGERLTHFLFMDTKGDYGPHSVNVYSYESRHQLVELLGLLKSFSDQTLAVRMLQPGGVQMQDFFDRPFRNAERTKGGQYACDISARAFWQLRMLDVAACVTNTPWRSEPTRFNVEVTDPVVVHLDGPWAGVGGSYVFEADDVLSVEHGRDGEVPTLRCSVNALTRWWMGVVPASGLALRPGFDADPELLTQLDHGLITPEPSRGWNF